MILTPKLGERERLKKRSLNKGVWTMIVGIIFIIAGILIALYPPLLALIVAGILIFSGISFVTVSYHYKKASKRLENPYLDFFIRF